MKKKLTYRDIQNNKIRMELMQKGGFSLLRNPNPKLRGIPVKGDNVSDSSQNVATEENQ